jgi:N-hydroxyarylamine O-acetyltransferase
MVLLVGLGDQRWIADAGLGEGFMEPLPLREGTFERGPFTYTLTREPEGTWWMGQHQWSSVSGFRMQPAESTVAEFEPHHRRLALQAHSSFVRTLVVQSPRDDRIVTLRARTLSEIGPWVDTKRVLSRDEFAPVLRDVFGIAVSGSRLERLWRRAASQHDAFVASVANTGH